jgi:opacity protein-like surface antigen
LAFLRIETLRIAAVVVVLLLVLSGAAAAQVSTEWQVRPFIGVTFGGSTTLNDPDQAVGGANLALGVGASLLGNVFGVEGELGHAPGFFQEGEAGLVSSSRVTTLTGNVILGLPRTATEYTLRPYFVGGAGVMWARAVDAFNSAVPVKMTRPAFDLGGGVSGALSNRTGVSWDVRYFRSFAGVKDPLGIGTERLSFWRANMALVIRL